MELGKFMLSQLGADSIASKQAKQQTILSASIASRVYPNQQFVGTIGAIGRDSGQGCEYRECPDQIGTVDNYACMYYVCIQI